MTDTPLAHIPVRINAQALDLDPIEFGTIQVPCYVDVAGGQMKVDPDFKPMIQALRRAFDELEEPDATTARYEREDTEARQDDLDTVTLLRDDAAQLLRFWEGDRTSNAPNTMASRVRAALGWGDGA